MRSLIISLLLASPAAAQWWFPTETGPGLPAPTPAPPTPELPTELPIPIPEGTLIYGSDVVNVELPRVGPVRRTLTRIALRRRAGARRGSYIVTPDIGPTQIPDVNIMFQPR